MCLTKALLLLLMPGSCTSLRFSIYPNHTLAISSLVKNLHKLSYHKSANSRVHSSKYPQKVAIARLLDLCVSCYLSNLLCPLIQPLYFFICNILTRFFPVVVLGLIANDIFLNSEGYLLCLLIFWSLSFPIILFQIICNLQSVVFLMWQP